ncbi:hypothetical protein FB45DRAFT_899388 [Roridomyces roridus]|uniref:SET domain-containing protein n=1 Tax=Roridomyces roridus TaxID=1738132 RepID=A0AAD7FW99_9AGAR|nr:hypothetical protein FB45DRAFT_899388 [Roridomyces roridus]
MKRGFLNSSRANARPVGSPAAPVVIPNLGTGKYSIGKQNVEVPEGYESEFVHIERDPRSGSFPGGITYTTAPFVDAAPGEPTTECIFHPGSKEVLMDLPGFSQPMVKRVGRKSPIRVKEVQGMGLGLFASRGIKARELIFSERPLLVAAQLLSTRVPSHFTREQQLQYSLDQLEKTLAFAVDRMSDEDKAAYMALKNSHLEDGSGPLVGIMRTNGLGISGLRPEITDGSPAGICCGVCNMISRLNHSCSPNVITQWSMLKFSFQVFAVRDIAADEELTYRYINIEASTAQRNEKLKPYDFVCACSSCKDPESDARRADLAESDTPTVKEWLSDDEPHANARVLDECRRQMELLEREGMQAAYRYFGVSVTGFTVCVASGDAESASEWARKLARIRWVEEVPKDIESFLDPKSRAYKAHPMWLKRIDGATMEKDVMVELAAIGIGSVTLED